MKGNIEKQIKLDHPEVLKVLFHPRHEPAGNTPPNCIDHNISVDEEITVGARFHLTEQKDSPNILFFHGNGEIVSDYDDIGPSFVAHGMSFLAVDYRGYGWSKGEPSASKMLRDSHVIIDFVKTWLSKEGRKGCLVVMGRSLGSACAIELASTEREAVSGLIIDSGFASSISLLECLGLDAAKLDITEEECFNNPKKMATIVKPTFILHAQHDQFIPVNDASELQARCMARSSEFKVVPGADHNTIFSRAGKLYFEVIQSFVKKIGMPIRRRRTGVRK